jgi:rhodanese-like protein
MKNIKPILLSVLIIVLFISCSNEIIVVYDISKERFQRELATHNAKYEEYLIIDSRSEQAYLAGHLPDALNYNIEHIKKNFSEIEDLKELPTYVYGKNLDESFAVAKYLGQHGYKKIFNCMGTDEAKYDFVMYHPVRLRHGFELAKKEEYQLVDYRIKSSHDQYKVPNVIFLPYPNIDKLLNVIRYNHGYVVFSTSSLHAKECAELLVHYGFHNVYYCVDNIVYYPEYFEYNERQLDTNK